MTAAAARRHRRPGGTAGCEGPLPPSPPFSFFVPCPLDSRALGLWRLPLAPCEPALPRELPPACSVAGASGLAGRSAGLSDRSCLAAGGCPPISGLLPPTGGPATEFEGSSKYPAPQPKPPQPAPRFLQGSSLEEPDFGRFVHHRMPSRAETFCVQLSVSKHVIASTVNVSIKLDHVVRCEGIPQCMLRVVLEARCADDVRLAKVTGL